MFSGKQEHKWLGQLDFGTWFAEVWGGDALPYHNIDVSKLIKEDLLSFIIQCAKRTTRENYNPSAEFKIAAMSIQNTPPDMSPALILAGLPQTINDSNSWGANILKVCVEAAEDDSNLVVLNATTDGV